LNWRLICRPDLPTLICKLDLRALTSLP